MPEQPTSYEHFAKNSTEVLFHVMYVRKYHGLKNTAAITGTLSAQTFPNVTRISDRSAKLTTNLEHNQSRTKLCYTSSSASPHFQIKPQFEGVLYVWIHPMRDQWLQFQASTWLLPNSRNTLGTDRATGVFTDDSLHDAIE